MLRASAMTNNTINNGNIPYKPLLDCPEPECDGRMRLRRSNYGLFYGCNNYPKCNATHQADEEGNPVGEPADSETKEYRRQVYEVFGKLWDKGKRYVNWDLKQRNKFMSQTWLAYKMEMELSDCNINRFDIEQCKHALDIIEGVTIYEISAWYVDYRHRARSQLKKQEASQC